MNTLYIQNLNIQTVIGDYAWERQIRQKIMLSIEMDPLVPAAELKDDLSKGVDYKAVIDAVIAKVENSEFRLIESLAEAVAQLILEHFPVREVRIDLSKPGICAQAERVGIRIQRQALTLSPQGAR